MLRKSSNQCERPTYCVNATKWLYRIIKLGEEYKYLLNYDNKSYHIFIWTEKMQEQE